MAGGDQQLAIVPHCQWPQKLCIGTCKAFEGGYAYAYEKKELGTETIYVCTKGSEWARNEEFLVLRCEGGIWTAYDAAFGPDGVTAQCRQPVFRCVATDITQPGWHKWETNRVASSANTVGDFEWRGALHAETRVP